MKKPLLLGLLMATTAFQVQSAEYTRYFVGASLAAAGLYALYKGQTAQPALVPTVPAPQEDAHAAAAAPTSPSGDVPPIVVTPPSDNEIAEQVDAAPANIEPIAAAHDNVTGETTDNAPESSAQVSEQDKQMHELLKNPSRPKGPKRRPSTKKPVAAAQSSSEEDSTDEQPAPTKKTPPAVKPRAKTTVLPAAVAQTSETVIPSEQPIATEDDTKAARARLRAQLNAQLAANPATQPTADPAKVARLQARLAQAQKEAAAQAAAAQADGSEEEDGMASIRRIGGVSPFDLSGKK